MKVALICPSNLLFMPYVNNYTAVLKDNHITYDIINWDRFHIEGENSEMKFWDIKKGHQRNLVDYYKYKRFIIEKLESNNYDKVIVFGIQLTFFIRRYLLNNFKGKYIVDIRDYNKVMRFFNIKSIVEQSDFTVISSVGYKEWLPASNKYIINHNTTMNSMKDLKELNYDFVGKKINIACIGALRDYKVNIDFVNSIKKTDCIDLIYHGEGNINKNIDEYLIVNDIRNVILTGRYDKIDEEELYNNADLINVFRYNDGINNKTALPNRLYNATIHGKPMIGFKGTYLAEEIIKYRLGLIVNSFDDIEDKINNYIMDFDLEEYKARRFMFLENVVEENRAFKKHLIKFINK